MRQVIAGHALAGLTLSGCSNITTCYQAITSIIQGLIEAVKSFIESVCITILTDFRAPLATSTPTLSQLFTAALASLGLQNRREGNAVDNLLSAFNRFIGTISDVRNEFGTLAHGRDGFFPALNRDENRALLHIGDAVLALLLNALDGVSPDLASTREPYERFQRFSERIDQCADVSAEIEYDETGAPVIVVTVTAPGGDPIPISVEPSRLLFMIDRGAYVEVLNASAVDVADELDDDGKDDAPELTASPLYLERREEKHVVLAGGYEGTFSGLNQKLYKFLDAQAAAKAVSTTGAQLIPSLLATIDANMVQDVWKSVSGQARLTIALRSVFRAFGVNTANELATRTVNWLRVQCPE